MALIGMDVAAVAATANRLTANASQIADLTRQLDATVTHLSEIWHGHDATVFASQTWPAHRQRLQSAQSALAQLGQNVQRNVPAQRSVSQS